jgi:hypothetical protein
LCCVDAGRVTRHCERAPDQHAFLFFSGVFF